MTFIEFLEALARMADMAIRVIPAEKAPLVSRKILPAEEDEPPLADKLVYVFRNLLVKAASIDFLSGSFASTLAIPPPATQKEI
jgi:hypothetical protein